jgi:uncharacterized membrane protein (UPF0127 family)
MVGCAGVGLFGLSQPQLPTIELLLTTSASEHPITAELAGTQEEKACGLMGRPALAEGQGMLFDVRPAGPSYFWMDNTPEPLDMIFVGEGGIVLHIEHETVPFSRRRRGTQKPVVAVLELAAGVAERWNVKLGDRLSLPWEK